MKAIYRQIAAAATVLLIAVGITTASLSTGSTQAQDVDKMSQRQGQLLKQLNLTPDQLQKLKTIRESNRDALRNNMQQLRQAQQELRNLMTGSASAEQIRSKFNQVQDLRQQSAKMHFEQMLAMREVLTPEQRTKFEQLMSQNREQMRQRMRDRFQQRQNQPQNQPDR